jgi:predicted transcriptional regulator
MGQGEGAMSSTTITLDLPENLYLRLQQTAEATRQSLDAVLMRALQVGSPPTWETAPAEFQADLAALDRLDDAALWRIARARTASSEMDRYQALLDKNANQTLSASERNELAQLRTDQDREMLRKAHAASLLQWRGHQIPPADKL